MLLVSAAFTHDKGLATFHCNKDSNSRSFQIMKGEQHAPFWVTLLVAISATGQLLNPMLIFQGGKDITADKIGDVSTERKRKFPSASSSSVSAESPTCRFPSIEKNTREIKKMLQTRLQDDCLKSLNK